MNPSSPGIFFWEFFLLQIRFHFYWSFCSNFLFLLGSALVCCIFLEICPFFLSCPICWSITVHNIVINFCITIVSVVISSLSFLILFIWVLSLFFLVNLAKCLSILFIFIKKKKKQQNSSWSHWSFQLVWGEVFFSLYFIWMTGW